MYAKVVWGTADGSLPLILITSEDPTLAPTLHSHGWTTWGEAPPTPAGSATHISPEELRIYAGGQILIKDGNGNPKAPAGWGTLIESLEDQAVVAVLPPGVPLEEENLKAMFAQILDSPSSAVALLPITFLRNHS